MGYIIALIRFIRNRIRWRGLVSFYISTRIAPNSNFQGANKIYRNTSFNGSMGYGSYIGSYCKIKANVGKFTSIANYVRTHTGYHPITTPYATTSPMFYSIMKQNGSTFANRMMFEERKSLAKIGNDVWIGENVFFVGGITIGDGAVILAGAVVTKDVPPYAVVGGVPAKVLKYRYDEDTISFLLDFKWWDLDLDWLKNNWELLCDIKKLKKKFDNR